MIASSEAACALQIFLFGAFRDLFHMGQFERWGACTLRLNPPTLYFYWLPVVLLWNKSWSRSVFAFAWHTQTHPPPPPPPRLLTHLLPLPPVVLVPRRLSCSKFSPELRLCHLSRLNPGLSVQAKCCWVHSEAEGKVRTLKVSQAWPEDQYSLLCWAMCYLLSRKPSKVSE